MKKYLFIMSLLVIFTATGCIQESQTNETPATDQVEAASPDKDTVVVSGSSTLEDDTGYGFAYEPVNVFDLDYSTAWCSTDEDMPELTLTFIEPTQLGTVGIVPGFARDEDIFYQNNRLKTVEVWYDDQTEAALVLSFDDTYEMQFFDIPDATATKVILKITEVYSGSKYDDTCVSEVDFWNEWVETEDASASYNYYLEYKRSFSLRPVGLEKMDLAVGQSLENCGSILESYYTTEDQSMGNVNYYRASNNDYLYSHDRAHGLWYFSGSDDIAISAQMNEWAEAGDEVEITWVMESFIMPSPNYPQFLSSNTIEVQECSDGNLYISDTFAPGAGHYSISIYYENKLIGKEEYVIAQ